MPPYSTGACPWSCLQDSLPTTRNPRYSVPRPAVQGLGEQIYRYVPQSHSIVRDPAEHTKAHRPPRLAEQLTLWQRGQESLWQSLIDYGTEMRGRAHEAVLFSRQARSDTHNTRNLTPKSPLVARMPGRGNQAGQLDAPYHGIKARLWFLWYSACIDRRYLYN
ncbi:hypothetical protein GGR56DRAFT_102316 [Xylariaceae sp. FL0804]|nr:hypothetical protein GGR56DRAFT_102316 [Xylariaceae sp. FL0804]